MNNSEALAKKQLNVNPVPETNPFTFANGNPKQMSTNCVTKFAFATKTGMAPSNPNK